MSVNPMGDQICGCYGCRVERPRLLARIKLLEAGMDVFAHRLARSVDLDLIAEFLRGAGPDPERTADDPSAEDPGLRLVGDE